MISELFLIFGCIGGAKESFEKFSNKTFGRMMNTPMTREESVKILGIER